MKLMLSPTRMESVEPPRPVPTSLHVQANIGFGIARGRPSGYALCPPTTQNAASLGKICVFCMKKLPPEQYRHLSHCPLALWYITGRNTSVGSTSSIPKLACH